MCSHTPACRSFPHTSLPHSVPQAPVHAHLQGCLQVLGCGGDDALAANTNRYVVKQGLQPRRNRQHETATNTRTYRAEDVDLTVLPALAAFLRSLMPFPGENCVTSRRLEVRPHRFDLVPMTLGRVCAPPGLTPTCASCSLTGCTCSSVRLVRSRRTPQLMSKPTPPGDTTAWHMTHTAAADTAGHIKVDLCQQLPQHRHTCRGDSPPLGCSCQRLPHCRWQSRSHCGHPAGRWNAAAVGGAAVQRQHSMGSSVCASWVGAVRRGSRPSSCAGCCLHAAW